ncbi:transcription cofactor vestigial-like protein 4 [Branchiostoma floridae x Branchiostoma belcheri]
METPLDVLSRAASMVETDNGKAEEGQDKPTLHNGDCNSRLPPSPRHSPVLKEQPSKVERHRRSTERRELSHVLGMDEEQRAKVATMKCAGTQTHLTSVKETANLTDEALETINNMEASDRERLLMSMASKPMLIPMSSLHSPLPHPPQRPSVITCAPAFSRVSPPPAGNGVSTTVQGAARREIITTGVVDPVIEEHFRRSLGKDYKVEEPPAEPPRAASTPPDPNNVSITGSVDDHFAKALGDTWTKIKARKESVSSNKSSPPPSPHLPASHSTQPLLSA